MNVLMNVLWNRCEPLAIEDVTLWLSDEGLFLNDDLTPSQCRVTRDLWIGSPVGDQVTELNSALISGRNCRSDPDVFISSK